MNMMLRRFSLLGVLGLAGAVGILAGCKSMGPGATVYEVSLSVSNEVPPVNSTATGSGSVTINTDHSVAAKITVSGMTATAAHIHEGATGTNGPVIIPFTKTADNTFEAPAGAKLTDAQYDAYTKGNLYVNVHSAKYPGGEVRAQLKPK
jgi:hypothetical protein